MLGKIEGKRKRGWQNMRWLNNITDSMDTSLSKLQELAMDRKPGMLQSTESQRIGHNLAIEQRLYRIYCIKYWLLTVHVQIDMLYVNLESHDFAELTINSRDLGVLGRTLVFLYVNKYVVCEYSLIFHFLLYV